MSGLEILGAVGAAASLAELAAACSRRMIHLKARSDTTTRALLERVEVLNNTINDVREVLRTIYTQSEKRHRLTEPESRIWNRMQSVLFLCQCRLQQLHRKLEDVSAKTDSLVDRKLEAFKLSVALPDMKRMNEDIDTFVHSLTMLRDLLQALSLERHYTLQRAMHRDIREIKEDQGDKLEEALNGISQIKNQLQRPLPLDDPSDITQDVWDTQGKVDNLSVHLEEILIAAGDVKHSFESPETYSVSSEMTESSKGNLLNSSASSNLAETQSLPSIQLPSATLSNTTHIEPLRELAQRFKIQAEKDISLGFYQCAESSQLESIKCYEELHDCHTVLFDCYHDMKMTLATIFKEQKKYEEAQAILKSAREKGRLRYEHDPGWKSMSPDTDEDAGYRALADQAMADMFLDMYQTSAQADCLYKAEKHAKDAFQIRREICGRDSAELKQTVQLLVRIYSKNPGMAIYADTYRDLYLDSEPRNLSLVLSENTSLISSSINAIDSFSIIEAVKSHKDEDVEEKLDLIHEASHAAINLNEVRDGKSAMMLAMDCGCHRCESIVDKLLRSGASRDAPFQYAVKQEKMDQCSLLLEHDANINKLDSESFTPLMNAIKRESKAMVSFLIANNANLNVPGYNGQTALHIAVKTRSTDVLKLLLEKKADLDIESRDQHGMTALHYCARHDKSRFARRLERAGANLEAKDDSINRRTPLWIAVKEGKYAFAETLLQLKAQVDLEYLPPVSGDIRNLLRNHRNR